MTIEEYKARIEGSYKEYCNNINRAKIEFALSNNPVQIGDIIYTNNKIGRVIEYNVFMQNLKVPQIVYTCKQLRKNGLDRVDGKVIKIWQSNVIKINDEDYIYPFLSQFFRR